MYRKILLLDNFDSFTYNLVDFFRLLGCSVRVFRNTAPVELLAREDFDLLVLSPGPSVPKNAGNLMAVIAHFYRQKPILGVCLGHQALIEFFGGSLENIAPVHGKSVPVEHDGRSIFTGLEPGISVARYHSWAARDIPPELEVSARAADGTVMAVRHKRLPIEGIQFHPESVLSMRNDAGMRLLRNTVQGRLADGNRIYHQLTRQLQEGSPLDDSLLREFLNAVDTGQLSDDQKQMLLVALSLRLREPAALRQFVGLLLPERFGPWAETAVDVCGTGGSGLPRINTSTLVSLLLAYCGLPIAKHGNRAAAGRFGSFDLLEALDTPIRFDLEKARRALCQTRLAFLFAPDIYPVFRHFAPVRARLGVPTVFNALGPLLNPCRPRRQFIGTAFPDLMDVIFETGIQLGRQHLIVARSWDGLDEISLSAPTRILEFFQGERQEYELSAADFGLPPQAFEVFSAANPAESQEIARAILAGAPRSEHFRLVAANAAFIYSRFAEPDLPLKSAYRKMEKFILEGALGQQLERYKSAFSETIALETATA
ncbi:MAG: anthranilate phosphoribosyltransferase [Saprospiraceae bacterium]|nr:anthranilate phosphoribosyltransferase [Saprospiraceae bacterium]